VVVGIVLSRRVKDAKDYFLAGRSLTFWVIGLSIIGTNIGANDYVGAAGSAYRLGIAQANFEWIGAIPAMIIASLIFIPVYWRAGVYSIPEYLGKRYNQHVRVVSALITSIFSVFAVAVSLWAIALTLHSFLGWPIWLGILVTGTVVGLYSIAGGLAAVAFTDAFQVLIMFVGGIAIVYIGLNEAGGLEDFAAQLTAEHPTHLQAYLPPDHQEFPWHAVILGLGFVLSPAYWCGSQAILQRALGARTQWDASASMMFAAFAKTLVPLLIVFPGLVALVMKAQMEYPDMALPWVIKNLLPPGLSGLMFVAVIAALQSSLDSMLNSTSLLITRDIRGVLLRNANPDNDLKVGRLLTLLILLGGMLAAPFIADLGGIYAFLQKILSLFQGPMLALLLLGALTRHASPTAGLIVLISGVPIAGLLMYLDMNMLYVAFTTFVYSMIGIWLLSYRFPNTLGEELDRLVFVRG
jgi:SSS family solute:Na+ symporter